MMTRIFLVAVPGEDFMKISLPDLNRAYQTTLRSNGYSFCAAHGV
jgi:hypothetical protein